MERRKKIVAFICIEFGLVILCTLPLFLLRAEPMSLLVLLTSVVFMFLPAISTLIVKRLTHDEGGLFLRLNIRREWKRYLLAAFLPGALEGIGVISYFFVFPDHLDISLTTIEHLLVLSGREAELPQLTVPAAIGVGLLLAVVAPSIVVNHIAAFGEEIGWRGFLLPLLVEGLGVRKAVLLDGILWGIAHAPLVCFGLNYTGDHPGAPWTGILMMILFATSTGIFLSYLTLSSKSIFPACIAHGAINAIREAPLLICLNTYNALLGPKPSGLIGMTGFLIAGAVIFIKPIRSTGIEASAG